MLSVKLSVLLAMLVVLWHVLPVAAGSITINFGAPQTLTTTASHDAFLTNMLARENARRAAQTPPLGAFTMERYLQDLIVKMLRGYQTEAAGLDSQDACATFQGLLTAQQQSILTSLGGKSPCPR